MPLSRFWAKCKTKQPGALKRCSFSSLSPSLYRAARAQLPLLHLHPIICASPPVSPCRPSVPRLVDVQSVLQAREARLRAYSCVHASLTPCVDVYQFRLKAQRSPGRNERFVMHFPLQFRAVAPRQYNMREERLLMHISPSPRL